MQNLAIRVVYYMQCNACKQEQINQTLRLLNLVSLQNHNLLHQDLHLRHLVDREWALYPIQTAPYLNISSRDYTYQFPCVTAI